jgi:hypothetical protein
MQPKVAVSKDFLMMKIWREKIDFEPQNFSQAYKLDNHFQTNVFGRVDNHFETERVHDFHVMPLFFVKVRNYAQLI